MPCPVRAFLKLLTEYFIGIFTVSSIDREPPDLIHHPFHSSLFYCGQGSNKFYKSHVFPIGPPRINDYRYINSPFLLCYSKVLLPFRLPSWLQESSNENAPIIIMLLRTSNSWIGGKIRQYYTFTHLGTICVGVVEVEKGGHLITNSNIYIKNISNSWPKGEKCHHFASGSLGALFY